MKSLLLAVILAGESFVTLRAGGVSLHDGQDTSKVYPLGEVVTTASRLDALLRTVPTSLNVISRQQVELKPGHLVSDLLAGVPGIFIRSYGGGSSLQTLSLRGMSPENTLVLIDGQRINSYQNGQIDLGFLSAANVDRVEIVKGGYSALYGADAVGGVVNITTRRPQEPLSGTLLQTVGMFGYRATEAAIGGRSGSLGWRADFRRESGRGDYNYFFDDGRTVTETTRNGNDFQMTNAQVLLDFGKRETGRAFLLGSYSDAGRGVCSPVYDLSNAGSARLSDRTLRSIAGGEIDVSQRITARLTGMFFYADEQYIDPSILLNGVALQSVSINRAIQVVPELRWLGSSTLSGSLGLEYGRAWFRGSDLNDANRYQQSVYLTAQHTISLTSAIPFEVIVFPSIRYDRFSDVDGDISPKVGVNIGLLNTPDLRLRSSYGKSYRVPTFNDLYWITGGNPNLKPERSVSFDTGLLFGTEWGGTWMVDVNYFDIRTRDRIAWVPSDGMFWSPKNLSEVDSKGVEVEGTWTGFGGRLQISLTSSWNHVIKASEDFPGDPTTDKQLIYVPKQTVTGTAIAVLGEVRVYLQHNWIGYRYTTESNDKSLPSYAVTSAALRYGVPLGSLKGFLKVEATNIFNSQYQIIALYPMPLREVRVTVGGDL
jgi:outer membrane cobalamin receptor